MVGRAQSIAGVPLRDLLPTEYAFAESALRALATELDTCCPPGDSVAWHWFPEHVRVPDTPPPKGTYVQLVDITIMLYNVASDWLELSLDIAWRSGPTLTVNAALEVACWCPQDHNAHDVRQASWPVTDGRELVEAFAAGVTMLGEVVRSGPHEPHPWRTRAGLPDAPPTTYPRSARLTGETKDRGFVTP